jgi:hypothetical protein
VAFVYDDEREYMQVLLDAPLPLFMYDAAPEKLLFTVFRTLPYAQT